MSANGVEEMLASFTELHPCLSQTVAVIHDEWQPEPPPSIFMAARLGDAVAICKFTDEQLRELFELVEDWMCNGDEDAQAVLATGFLEALLSQADHGRFDFRRASPFIGGETRKYCQAWDRFCGIE